MRRYHVYRGLPVFRQCSLNSANRSTYQFMSRICFTASELVDGGGGQPLMSPSSRCTSSSSWSSPRRSVIPRLPVLRLFFYLLSVSFRVCPGTVVHRLQVPRKVSHVRVVRVWGSSLLLSIAHVSRTSVCLHHRQYDRLSSISGFFGTQISSVFRRCRVRFRMSELSVYGAHLFYCLSRTYRAPSSLLFNMYDIDPHCTQPLHHFRRRDGGGHIMSNVQTSPFNPIIYQYISYINADSVDATVKSEVTDMVQFLHFLEVPFSAFLPVFCPFQFVRFCKIFVSYHAKYRWGRRADKYPTVIPPPRFVWFVLIRIWFVLLRVE